MSGWPADFLTVELRGQQTGHGSADIMDYYINQPAPDFNAMGTYFGVDVATGERTPRRRDAWNEAVFYLSDGKTYVSVNNSFNTCVVETPLVAIELLNRSGWYLTRGGDPAIMLWDDICVMPLLRILTPEETGDWVSVDGAADIVISSSPTQDIVLLPDTKSVARFVKPDAGYRASWRVSQGMIEIWFWDPYLQDPGYKTEIGLENPSTGEFIQATAYSVLMNEVAASYYASTDKTGHGGSFSTPRSKGWHRVVFRKVNDQIRVSIDGVMADGDALMWNDPPANLEFYARSGNSNYPEGSAVWFSRAVFTGDETTSLPDWRWR